MVQTAAVSRMTSSILDPAVNTVRRRGRRSNDAQNSQVFKREKNKAPLS